MAADTGSATKVVKVGILGFGHLGKHLYEAVKDPGVTKGGRRYEICFVWNRTASALEGPDGVPEALRLGALEDAVGRGADIVVEVAHPQITVQMAEELIRSGIDFVVGSPTALADSAVEERLRAAAAAGPGGLCLPSGALWGAQDLHGMANRGAMAELTVTMRKHPASFRLTEPELDKKRSMAETSNGEMVLYDGPVRGLCPLAPNNVNTMACAALAAHNLGFDGTRGRLVADNILATHEIEIEALGKPTPDGTRFRCYVARSSPAPVGAVTSKATYASFLESLLRSGNLGPGVHFV